MSEYDQGTLDVLFVREFLSKDDPDRLISEAHSEEKTHNGVR
jgi:hypothetical protein